MARKGTNYKQRNVDGDEFYRRASIAEDILEGIISPKTSSPIESRVLSGSSSNMQPYSCIKEFGITEIAVYRIGE